MDTVVYSGSRSSYTVTATAAGFTVTDKTGADGVDTLSGVERLAFSDGHVALDIDGNAGMAYRLYQAAFDRTPDLPGLGFWIWVLDQGYSLYVAAAAFVTSDEFVQKYGANLDTAHFVSQLYANVLHRAPDPSGDAYWQAVLDQHLITRADALAFFSESPENKANVIGAIQNGIDYIA
jgi:hypothetical protein